MKSSKGSDPRHVNDDKQSMTLKSPSLSELWIVEGAPMLPASRIEASSREGVSLRTIAVRQPIVTE